ncbi:EAL domain-containing protein [Paeniroseomonas aquatica]|uniref:bifunctional diguanylate cyclase/phosphodiesterase n=1 Tax=Paeniroseomonas aquatica TaxID=373043 RepID=UPI003612E1ED
MSAAAITSPAAGSGAGAAAMTLRRAGEDPGRPDGRPRGRPPGRPRGRQSPAAQALPGPRRPGAPPRRGRPGRLLLICGIVLGLAAAAATGLLLAHLRARTLQDSSRHLSATALILAGHAERSFEAVEQLQTSLHESLRSQGLGTPDDFRRLMAGEATHHRLRNRAHGLPQLDAVTAIDADGQLVNFSRYWPIPPVNVADRDYFQALKADPGRLSYISAPVPNRGTGTWTIYLARRVSAADGEFLGLLLGAVELAYFERLYASVLPDPTASIALLRQDGTLLARQPHLDASIGRSFAQAGVFRQLEASGARHALVRQVSQADGQDRLIAAHRLSRYPLVVTVTAATEAVLAEWRNLARYLVGAALLFELVVAAIGLLMLRQFRSQRQLAEAEAAMREARAARGQAETALALSEERMRAAAEARLQHLRFGAALANMSQALCMFDAADRLVVANARLAGMFALPAAALEPGRSLAGLLALARRDAGLARGDAAGLARLIRRLKARRQPAAEIREMADGRSFALSFRPLDDDNGWLVTAEDITERQQAEAKIAHMAHHDALTGLPNRLLFQKRLGQAIARSRRGEACAVLCLDLDHFKAVNDTLGHPVGDALLRAVTRRLRALVRETDTVARLGGDEFAVVQTCLEAPQDPAALATRLIAALAEPFDLEGHQVVIGSSVGIALVPGDGCDPAQILKRADLALYRAKADGRGRHRCFEPGMDALMQARRALEMDLRQALLRGEFDLHYQPMVTLRSRRICGFEALLRWNHPTRGVVPPAEFVALAETTGLIVPIGAWALRRACADAMAWDAGIKVAVNLSPVQFGNRRLVQEVAHALQHSGLPPHRLELEITETVMMEDTEGTLETLHALRGLGVGIAMDDFGTGYSSLGYLRRFPFDNVKIDRSFIEGLGQGATAMSSSAR